MDTYLESILGRDDVRLERTVTEMAAEEFAKTRERAGKIRGGVAVATVDAGEVLLVRNEWMDGHGFPGGGVEPGEDWESAATREVEEETGVAVDVERPWLVERQFYEHDGQRCDGGHTVFYVATPRGDRTVTPDPGLADEVIEDVGWFDGVPGACERPDRVRTALDLKI